MRSFKRAGMILFVLSMLVGLFATPTSVWAAAISGQVASNNVSNVYYSFSYSGSNLNYFRVYIDTDQNSATGLAQYGIGADYLLEGNHLYHYSGLNNNWGWTDLGAVTYVNTGAAVSWTVARSAMGETASPNSARLVFQVDDGALTTTSIYTHTYSLNPTPTRTRTPLPPTVTATPAAPGFTTVIYTGTNTAIANPERGFLHTHSPCNGLDVTVATLQSYRTTENISLVLCNFYLTAFKTKAIDAATLSSLQAYLTKIRAAGLKVVLRFSYTETDNVDASLAQILAHIDQLKPTIQAYTDVILLWQAGFVGEWGEWYYTSHFGNAGNITAQQWLDRKAVVDKMLAVLPASRMISLRTPFYKRKMYQSAAILPAQAFTGIAIARIGQFNDAFVSSDTDMGTYQSPQNAVEYPWLKAESTYLPMGGENAAWAGTRSSCATATQEMKDFHWSYMNIDYHPTTISNWNTGGCLATMKLKLGYRFALVTGKYPTQATTGGALNVQFSVRNDGYAAPFNPRGRDLILRNNATNVIYRFPLASDPRRWLAGSSTNINQTVTLTGVPAGTYTLLLHLFDPLLKTRPEYAIRFANPNVWEAATGYNKLLATLTVH